MILTKLSRCPTPAGSWCRSERSLSLCLCDVCCLWPGWSCTASWVVISLSLLQSQHRLLASLCRSLSLSLQRCPVLLYSSTPLLRQRRNSGWEGGRLCLISVDTDWCRQWEDREGVEWWRVRAEVTILSPGPSWPRAELYSQYYYLLFTYYSIIINIVLSRKTKTISVNDDGGCNPALALY